MERIIDGVAHVTATAAAQELQTTQLKVLMLIKQNALTGCMVEGEWFVTGESLECAKLHGVDTKVQKQCKSACSGCGGH